MRDLTDDCLLESACRDVLRTAAIAAPLPHPAAPVGVTRILLSRSSLARARGRLRLSTPAEKGLGGAGTAAISVAVSAVNARSAFWFATYRDALHAPQFIEFVKRLMKHGQRSLILILDSLPAHKGPPRSPILGFAAGELCAA